MEYRYITKHGVGPGTLPKDVELLNWEDLPNYKTAIYLDRPLTVKELEYYDIYPEWIQESKSLILKMSESLLAEDINEVPTELYDKVYNVVHDIIINASTVNDIKEKVPEYDADWCREDDSPTTNKAMEAFVISLVNDLFYYYK